VETIKSKLRKEELDAFLSAPERSNTLSLNKNATPQEVLQCLKKEMSVFEATGSCPVSLEKSYYYVMLSLLCHPLQQKWKGLIDFFSQFHLIKKIPRNNELSVPYCPPL